MKKADIRAKLRSLPGGPEGFWAVAGAAMVLYGLREETGDLDLGCTGDTADRLAAEGYGYQLMADGERRFRLDAETEVFENWLYGSVLQVEGLPVISPEGLRELKLRLGREKDLRDIARIDACAARHGGTVLSLYTPEYRDLWFRQAMLSDEETMAYNHAWGGTIPFPEERWRAWYEHWLVHPLGKRYYRYVQDGRGTFVGEIAYHIDEESGCCLADVIIHARYRGRGFGSRALELLCERAGENGVALLYDDIAADNPALGMFLARGFREERRTEDKIYLVKRL